MKLNHILLLFVLIIEFTSSQASIAADSTSTTAPANAHNVTYCPPINALKKDPNTMIWSANGVWLSYSTSFATHIDKFLGAQWQGVNLGSLTCLYSSSEKMTFPIVLTYAHLAYQPRGGKWTKDLGGYENCNSSQQEECAFIPKCKQRSGDINEQVGQLKNTPTQQEIAF